MAIQLGRERCRVAITGRRRNRLEGVAAVIESVGGECLVLEGSVTDPETVKRHYAAIPRPLGWLGLGYPERRSGGSEQRQGLSRRALPRDP